MDPYSLAVSIVALVSVVAIVALSKRVRFQARGVRLETQSHDDVQEGQRSQADRQAVVTTRIVRVLLRTKSSKTDVHQSVKVVTNCRVPGKKKPSQIHLGYLSLVYEVGIPGGQRKKLLKNPRRRWEQYFQYEQVEVDWNDAERKLAALRERTRTPAAA